MVATLERAAARLFSTASFRPVLSGKDSSRTTALVSQLREALDLGNAPRRQVVDAAYDVLRREYRSEYLYRNLITSRLFVGRHRASNSVLLHELSIGSSFADCVLINGQGSVYEIKTEYDDPSRLASQVSDYRRAFPVVTLVLNEVDLDKYLPFAREHGLGIVALNRRGHLSSKLAAKEDFSGLDVTTMLNVLRLQETQQVLQECLGVLPDVPNGRRHAAYLEAAQRIAPREFQFQMQRALKVRSLAASKDLLLDKDISPLRAIISQLDPPKRQHAHLHSWLNAREE